MTYSYALETSDHAALKVLIEFGPQFLLELGEKCGHYFFSTKRLVDYGWCTREDFAGVVRLTITPKGRDVCAKGSYVL